MDSCQGGGKNNMDSDTAANSRLHNLLRTHLDLVEALAAIEVDDDDTISLDGGPRNRQQSTVSIVVSDSDNSIQQSPSNYNLSSSVSSQNLLRVCQDDDTISIASAVDFGVEEGAPWYRKVLASCASYAVEIVDAVSETNEDLRQQEDTQPATLNLKTLRRNVKRTLGETQPFLETGAGLRDIFLWKSPLLTFMTLCVYMYCVFKGWLVSLLLFLLLLQLAINYLSTQKNIKLGLTFLPQKPFDQRLDQSMELNGAPLVLDIARRAQSILEIVAEALEKLRYLFLWKRPRITLVFTIWLASCFLCSVVLSSGTLWTLIGLGVGVRLFITTYLFHRFPKLRPKLDLIVWFMDRLPVEQRRGTKRPPLKPRQSLQDAMQVLKDMGERTAFYQDSMLEAQVAPTVEQPKFGRKCVLVDKERSFPYTLGSGSIYLTQNYCLFKYARFAAGRRETFKIHFDDILEAKKKEPYKYLPGKALELYVEGRSKPYLFVGISKRDDFYSQLVSMAKTAGAAFAQT